MFYEIERRLLRREYVSEEEDGEGEIEVPQRRKEDVRRLPLPPPPHPRPSPHRKKKNPGARNMHCAQKCHFAQCRFRAIVYLSEYCICHEACYEHSEAMQHA